MLYHNTSMYILNHYTMKTFIQCIIFAILTFTSPFLDAQEKKIVCPNELQQEWANAEIGVIIHFDMPVFHPDYNWRQFGTHPSPSTFNPSSLDTDQWIHTAKSLGAKYAVLVAKHCSGFSLWPTTAHEYSIKNSPYKNGKGDIVAEFVASCRKYGIKPGIYASTTANGFLHVDNPGLVKKGSPVTQEEYNKIVETQLTELWSNYGKLFEIWFDGGVLSQQNGGADILTLIQRLQPNSIAFQGPYGYPNLIRWVGNEEGNSPYPCWATADATTSADGVQKIKGLYGNPHGNYWCPGEADFTLRRNDSFQGGWFWRANEDHLIFSTDELLLKYETSVGRNTNMLLGLVIDKNGLVPDADVKRAKEFGDIIRKTFSKPIRKISGKGYELSIRLNKETNISRIVLSEDIAFGERVLKYKLKGLCNGKWIQLSEGSCIGHKRIEHFPTHSLSVVKLEIEEAKDNPVIKSFAIY